MTDGYEVDTSALRVQANRDWTDAYELDGCAGNLSGVVGSAVTGAADSADLVETSEYALELFRHVLSELSDGAATLGSSEVRSAGAYDENEQVSSGLYQRMI